VAVATKKRRLIAAVAALLWVAACSDRRSPPTQFAVARVRPAAGSPVFLNQRLTVYFTEPVDALSVTPDTVRVVAADGHTVAMERLEVGSQVVTLHPRPPLTPALTDGSFVPGQDYTLEVAGYPQVNAVRSRSGRFLARGLRVPLPAVGSDGTAEYPRPLLPVGMGNEPFTLDPTRRLEVELESALLQLHFTLPPYPPSVQPQAFSVQRLVEPSTLRKVEVTGARVVRGVSDPFPGCTVELRLQAPLSQNDHLALSLVQGELGIVDYAGRPASLLNEAGGALRYVHVRSGSHVEVGRVLATDGPDLHGVALGIPAFEVRDRNRIVPQVRVAAGSGVHGVFAPQSSVRLGPSEALTLASGRVVWADATLELSGLRVPAGVRLTIGGFAGPVRILVTGSVDIAGEVVLETLRSPIPDADDPMASHVVLLREDSLHAVAGCSILAAGDIEISGRISHVQENEPMGAPLALVAGGNLALHGRIPPGTICACEGELTGELQSARPWVIHMRPGFAGLSAVTAQAYTPWVRLPAWVQGAVTAKPIADEGVEVLWQVAPPDSIDGTKVDRRPDHWSQPRPSSEPLVGVPGQFVRFLLRARVEPGVRRLPSIAGVVLTAP
jgi:hypothetical protein